MPGSPTPPVRGGLPRGVRLAGFVIAAIALFATAASAFASGPSRSQLGHVRDARPSELRHLVIHKQAKTVPDHTLHGSEGATTSLDAFSGRILVVNFWATWCIPCRKEMPALDRLEAALGGDGFAVVAINLDRNGQEKAREFYAEFGLENLAVYTDPGSRFARAAGALGLPATLLVEPDGAEIGRLVGEAEWDAPAVITYLGSTLPRILAAADSDY